jgi:hypothetical protein
MLSIALLLLGPAAGMLPQPIQSGTFSTGVSLTDPFGEHGSAVATLNVGAAGQAAVAKLTASPFQVMVGNPLVLHTQVDWVPVGALTFLYTQLPSGCISANGANLTCTPRSTGIYTPSVEVHDQGGLYANATTTVTVTSPSSPSGTSAGLPSWTWVALGAVVVATLLLTLVALARRQK